MKNKSKKNDERIHYLLPQKVYRCNKKYYTHRPFFMNEISKHFSVKIYARVVEVSEIDKNKFVKFDDRIDFESFFDGTSLKHILTNILYYKKKAQELPEDDLYFMHHPTNVSTLFSLFLRKRKIINWVKGRIIDRYRNNPFKIYGFSKDLLKEFLKCPLKLLGQIIIPKILFKGNLVFYTSKTTFSRSNHLNQYEFISCSPFNRDKGIIKQDINYNICFVGHERGHKGLHILLRALNHKKLKEKITLNIIGLDELEKKRNLKRLEGIDYNLHGKIYDRELFYKKLAENDIIIMPSFGEKQGKVQLEGMSAGVVPICSDSGGTYRTIKNYYNGLLFEEGSYKDLRRKILLLYSDKKLYEKLQKNGLEYIENFSLEEEVEKMAEIIKNFLWGLEIKR